MLAQKISEETGIPVKKFVFKTTSTDFCHVNSVKEKQELAKEAFVLNYTEGVKGKHVLLLDDIINSGTTVKEITEILKRSGAIRTDVLVLNENPL